MYEHNLRVWEDAKAVSSYHDRDSLQKAEKTILDRVRHQVAGQKILDIGVGLGRTTPYLLEVSSRYTAIDYSSEMVQACQDRFPGVAVLCKDARDMSCFDDEEFGFVLFSWNGIDYVSNQDRLLILGEVFRVLRPGGYFAFSTHNKDYAHLSKEMSPLMFVTPQEFLRRIFRPVTYNPLTVAKRVAGVLKWYSRVIMRGSRGNEIIRGIKNHWKNKRHQVWTSEYAILNDSGQSFALLTYYISIECQKRQLADVGFSESIRAFGREGREVTWDTESWGIYYLTQKER